MRDLVSYGQRVDEVFVCAMSADGWDGIFVWPVILTELEALCALSLKQRRRPNTDSSPVNCLLFMPSITNPMPVPETIAAIIAAQLFASAAFNMRTNKASCRGLSAQTHARNRRILLALASSLTVVTLLRCRTKASCVGLRGQHYAYRGTLTTHVSSTQSLSMRTDSGVS